MGSVLQWPPLEDDPRAAGVQGARVISPWSGPLPVPERPFHHRATALETEGAEGCNATGPRSTGRGHCAKPLSDPSVAPRWR
jgi:hypothetical protein